MKPKSLKPVLLDAIRAVGGSVDRVHERKHVKVYWRDRAGRLHVTTGAKSTNDERAALNARAWIRRQAAGVCA